MTINLPNYSNPAELFDPTPFGFCHTVKVPSNGELVYISGQSGGEGPEHILNEDFRHQVQVLLSNLNIALTAHELHFDDVIKITILIVDHNVDKLEIWSEEMQKRWSTTLPASTLIPVPNLAITGMKIEVDAIAFKSA
ncbi:Endoribonuclease L-PSP [Shewanella denitrificans OS217]|jgi:enamine deaminase RidA (YjgF/YER057c/UK114 family)|uniref:Endoribonuclease L-PSP n=1 Tax=Shewanella denitrificans (strain OS217 / ATCC BAA-1090 / DSM 15013) TaxID=318161 RepID=Q12RI9_SHEDO|nr:RidA family protein [Shewanella denitrificans]ABE53937.1 Endoribonuclease L-PSP [Shewanella denitrificans OS217]